MSVMQTENKHVVSSKAAWADQMHAKVFDYMHKMPKYIIKKHYESFGEGRLLRMFRDEIRGEKFFEIGCATGELYRYVANYMKPLQYFGFDISKPAIDRAESKYPQGNFYLLAAGFEEIVQKFGRPDVVWSRDVVLHQESPYDFLRDLIELSNGIVVLRLRTRDVGATETNSEVSCQLHWDKFWVPYIVLNTEEMIQRISEHPTVKRIVVSRHYEVLGGHNYRVLPKDLYFRDAGTAETAVFIQKGKRHNGSVDVTFMDGRDRRTNTLLDRFVQKAASRL